jgi:TPR repeat protein
MIQFVRLLLIAALLTAGVGGLAAQEKTKSKADTQQTASEPELDPNDPEDLEEILSIADDYYFGDTRPVDHAEAFKWYSLASEGGSAYAMNRLGLMYDNGEHVEEDLAEAFHWYELAAEAGLPVAMGNVGNMYEYGDGTGQDYQQALAWYRKGADAGAAFAADDGDRAPADGEPQRPDAPVARQPSGQVERERGAADGVERVDEGAPASGVEGELPAACGAGCAGDRKAAHGLCRGEQALVFQVIGPGGGLRGVEALELLDQVEPAAMG